MRTLLRILARLYPAAWRKRYGAEFEALIEDARPGLGGALNILKEGLAMQVTSWSPSRVLAVSAVAGILIAIGIAYAMPPKWSSTAVIQTDGQTPEWVHTIAETALSRTALTTILHNSGIYRENLKTRSEDDVLELFKRAIQVSPVPSANGTAFQVRFTYDDPRIAQQVTQTLAGNFIDSNFINAGANPKPETFRLVEVANLPQQPINPAFSAKIATAGLAGGMLLGGPIAFVLYRRRRPPQ